MSEFLNKK